MVALTTMNLSQEAWRSAHLLRAVPIVDLSSCYHLLSPALSIEEAGLMTYLQTPACDSGDYWFATLEVCRRLVQIGGRLPTADQLHQSFVKILSTHLATNKKVSFAFQQNSSRVPMMNPSPTEVNFSLCGSDSCSVCYGCGTSPQGCGCSCEGKTYKSE